MGDGFGEVHAEAAKVDRRIAGHQSFRQCGEADAELDGGARFRARRERQVLIHHGQDASIGRIDDYGGAVHIAEGLNGCSADGRVFAGGDIALSLAGDEGAGGKSLIRMMTSRKRCAPHTSVGGMNGSLPCDMSRCFACGRVVRCMMGRALCTGNVRRGSLRMVDGMRNIQGAHGDCGDAGQGQCSKKGRSDLHQESIL